MSHNGLTALQTSGFDKLRQHGVFVVSNTSLEWNGEKQGEIGGKGEDRRHN